MLIDQAIEKGLEQITELLSTQGNDIHRAMTLNPEEAKITISMKILLEMVDRANIGIKVGVSYVRDKCELSAKSTVSDQGEIFKDK